MWRNIASGAAIRNPSSLHNFQLISFADLKSYKFVFWFGMPSLSHNQQDWQILAWKNIEAGDDTITPAVLTSLYELILQKKSLDAFAIELHSEGPRFISLHEAWRKRFQDNLIFVHLDMTASSQSLGWNSRNFLTLMSLFSTSSEDCFSYLDNNFEINGNRKKLKVLLLRNAGLRYSTTSTLAQLVAKDQSVLLDLSIGSANLAIEKGLSIEDACSKFNIVGWEYNERNKPGPKVADLRATLDSKRLMSQAVDLNLRLMKWRMWPALDTEQLFATKVLLFGAGTLGCSVARTLIGWGVRNITFVDNGVVSYSNPVRQSLFEFEDCQQRKFKAIAAAERLRKIYPDIHSEGIVLTIPMPGHPFAASNNNQGMRIYPVLTILTL